MGKKDHKVVEQELQRYKDLSKQYKEAAQKWERDYNEKRLWNVSNTAHTLTDQRSARLNWLCRLCDLH